MSTLNQIVIQLILDTQQYTAGIQAAVGATQNLAKGATSAFQQIPNVSASASSAYQKFFQQTTQGSNQLNIALQSLGGSSTGFFSKFVSSAGEAITMSARFAALYVVVSGLKNTVASGIDEFVELDKNLRNIQSITLESDQSIGKLRDTLIGVAISGQSFGKSASELAAGMYELVSAGYSSAQATDLVKISAEGAAAGLSDTGTSSKLLLSILQAYHLPVTDAKMVMDQLFTTVDLGVLHFNDLGNTLGLVIPSAAALKIPIQEVSAAVELLTRQGQAPSRVMTNLNAVLTALLKPTPALALEIHKLGFETGEAAVNSLGFTEVVRRMSVDAAGSDTQLTKWFGNLRAIRGILPLAANDGQDFVNMLQAHNAEMDKGNRTDLAFVEQQKSIAYQWQELNARLRAFIDGVTTAAIPKVTAFLGLINSGVPMFANLISSITGSSAAMTLLRDAFVTFIGIQILTHLSAIGNAFQLVVAHGLDAIRMMYSFFALPFPIIGLVAAVAAFAALDVAIQHFGEQSAAYRAMAAIDEQTQLFLKDAERIDSAIADGTLSKFAGDLEKVQLGFEHTNTAAQEFVKGLGSLQSTGLDSILASAKAVLSDPIGSLLHGGADLTGEFKKKFADENQAVINGIGNDIKGLHDYADALTDAQLHADKLYSGKNLDAYNYALQTAYGYVIAQEAALNDVAEKHTLVKIAAHETTTEIEASNSRLEVMTGHLKALADTYGEVTKAVKLVTDTQTLQAAQDSLKVDELQKQADGYKAVADAAKTAHDDSIKALELEKTHFTDEKNTLQDQLDALKERRTAFEENYQSSKKTTDSLKEQAALLKDQIDKGTDVQNPFTLGIDRINAQSADPKGGLKAQLDNLEKQSKMWEARKKLQDDTKKSEEQVANMPELKRKYQLLQDQIKIEDAQQKKKDDDFKKQDQQMKDQETPLANQMKAIDAQAKALDHRIQVARDTAVPEETIYKTMQNQLEAAKGIQKTHEDDLKILAAQQALLIAQSQSQAGVLITASEQKALVEAITALYLNQPEKIQSIADKYQITNKRLNELLGSQTDFNAKSLTPKIDDSALTGLERHLSGIDAQVITPKVDSSQVDALDVKLDSIASKAARNTSDFIKSTLNNVFNALAAVSSGFGNTGTSSVPTISAGPIAGHADGGITTHRQLSWLSEDNKPELILPMSRPERAMQLMAEAASRFMPSRMRFGPTGDGSASGDVQNTNHSLYNYGTIVLDRNSGHGRTLKTDMMLSRLVS